MRRSKDNEKLEKHRRRYHLNRSFNARLDDARAGVLIHDRAVRDDQSFTVKQQCQGTGTTFFGQIKGILIVGITGLMISDAPVVESGCQTDGMLASDGLMVSDGMLASDGMLMSD